ncbi:MAG: T9SS type B sorting domain-containing protein [Crocinitomicaceae bacterium]|nr:MAG: T9SS type B sorting domain-containing protein [Crocinitomicaceae bacterium]
MFRLFLFFSVLGASFGVFGQQLIINEISQGTGSSEYVEFVVIGSATCTTPVPSLDLRKVIIDDNNGYFATGSGTGIASGAVRFANIPFWQSVPQGTYIVIYNEASPNSALPPNDLSLTDGNCRLIIPASSTLLEKTIVSPTTTNSAYPPDPDWTSGGAWNQLAMANSDDSFQVPTIPSTGIPFHSVSWGNNSNNTIIYFSGSAAGKVFSFTNNTSNNWNTQANWTSGTVGVNETPGAPNNAANDAWIATMNPQCSVNPGLTLTLTSINETCANACDGSITSSVTNGQAPFTYLWSNGSTSANLSNVCPGTYSLEITTSTGCSVIQSATVIAGQANADASIQNAGPFAATDGLQQIIAANSGGTWGSTCGTCISTSGVFNPQIAGEGTWQICYQLGTGTCADQQCINVIVTSGCTPQIVTENLSICPGDSVLIFGNYESTSGTYSQVFIDVNGCDSTQLYQLSIYTANDVTENIVLCEFDSVFVFNQWIYDSQEVTQIEQTADGCSFTHTINVVLENCTVEPDVIFIPNVFTANNDNLNDTFSIVVQGGIVEEGYVFNRWGNVIAEFSENQLSWDGTDMKSGLPVQDGVYTYIIYFKPANDVRKLYHGFVTVIR